MFKNIVSNFTAASPLEQFEVYSVLPFLSNNIIFLILVVLTVVFFGYMITMQKQFLVKSAFSVLKLLFQEQLLTLVARNLGAAGQRYYPILSVLFLFLLALNLIGLVPYTFTVTSHIVATFTLSFTFFVGTNLVAIKNKKLEYFGLFLPSGAPIAIIPFLIAIELISYFARVFSLAIRLFANMMAGHSLLKILIGFVYAILVFDTIGLLACVLPFLLVFVITFLEAGVALIQAYVFVVLMCVYIKDFYGKH
jgi:F-type H+-transporting ATPase subunit a